MRLHLLVELHDCSNKSSCFPPQFANPTVLLHPSEYQILECSSECPDKSNNATAYNAEYKLSFLWPTIALFEKISFTDLSALNC